jgi:hypothetical protein
MSKADTPQAEWPESAKIRRPCIYDLENCIFVFRGRSMSGERLAELLGLKEPGERKDGKWQPAPTTQS